MSRPLDMAPVGRAFARLRPRAGFRVILADPPWRYDAYSKKGEGKSPQRHYRCLPIEEICRFPVGLLAAADAALLMWCTWPMLLDPRRTPMRVLSAWGFRYAGLAWEWNKVNPRSGKRSFGGGYGTRKNFEPCILARRGHPRRRSRSETDIIEAPLREHSRKPDEQYPKIERLYAGPYIELFARTDRHRPGWRFWGDQLGRFEEAA